MKKNAQLHILIESETFKKLKKEAEEKGISLCELCRQKLRKSHQLDSIEKMIKNLVINR